VADELPFNFKNNNQQQNVNEAVEQQLPLLHKYLLRCVLIASQYILGNNAFINFALFIV